MQCNVIKYLYSAP